MLLDPQTIFSHSFSVCLFPISAMQCTTDSCKAVHVNVQRTEAVWCLQLRSCTPSARSEDSTGTECICRRADPCYHSVCGTVPHSDAEVQSIILGIRSTAYPMDDCVSTPTCRVWTVNMGSCAGLSALPQDRPPQTRA